MAEHASTHVPILQAGSLLCVCGKRDNDTSVHPQGIVATATLARDAEQHADALWHTLWFHTLNLHTMRRDEIGPHDPDASMFDSDEERQAYNAYQAERDIDAETDHHRRVVAACRDAYRRWGIKLPDDDTVIAHPTYASWRAAPSSTSPTGGDQ